MSGSLRLVLFDVDGTLVNSQNSIVAAMEAAFADCGLNCPTREQILSIVGLSLDRAMARLAPDHPEATQARLMRAYKSEFQAQRLRDGAARLAPLYPGARAVLERLAAESDTLLGVATGKSARGLAALLEAHDLERFFVTRQVADHHPSKPHPSMIQSAMAETGVGTGATAMIGDTSFDMDMACAAKVTAIGVSWGYHPTSDLRARAHHLVDHFDQLQQVLDTLRIPAA